MTFHLMPEGFESVCRVCVAELPSERNSDTCSRKCSELKRLDERLFAEYERNPDGFDWKQVKKGLYPAIDERRERAARNEGFANRSEMLDVKGRVQYARTKARKAKAGSVH